MNIDFNTSNLYDKQLLNEIYQRYIEKQMRYNSICEKCKIFSKHHGKELVNGPVPIYHVGKDYIKQKRKLLIIGTVSYGWHEKEYNIIDVWPKILAGNEIKKSILQHQIEKRNFELFINRENPFYRFINSALTTLFKSSVNGWTKISLTNFIHCNLGPETEDELLQRVRNYCADIKFNGYIHEEIRILKPTHIIGLSKWKHPRYSPYERFMDEYKNFKAIVHPSKPGRSIEEFTKDIKDFLNTPEKS